MSLSKWIYTLCLLGTTQVFGQPYWQQQVDTRIDVTLDDETHYLRGFIDMDYYNNSTDTLHSLYFLVYPNAYKTDRTAFEKQAVENGNTKHYFSKETERGFMDSLSFLFNETTANHLPTQHEDIIQVKLHTPLLPGEKANIKTPFRVMIPEYFSRMGYDENGYSISQWFPKPAVYEKEGWHLYPYLDQGEFYSEYGNYEVRITLPENYKVLATGELENTAEKQWLDSLSTIKTTNASTSIPESASRLKTVTFKANQVHDFAWFASKIWAIQKDTLMNENGNLISIYHAHYPENEAIWKNSTALTKSTIRSMEKWVGAYPYSTLSIVEGGLMAGAGMEYPTIAVIGTPQNQEDLNTVLVHEIVHNWFQGIIGNNERKHPWMDESITSYYEQRIIQQVFPESFSQKIENALTKAFAINEIKRHHHQTIATESEDFTSVNYMLELYVKGPKAFKWLEGYLGTEQFDNTMRQYFQDWQFKHPQPTDLANSFKKGNKNVSWFFDSLLNSPAAIDFNLQKIKHYDTNVVVTVKNNSNFAAPVGIVLADEKGKSKATFWSSPFIGKTTFSIPVNESFNHALLHPDILDINQRNNSLPRKFKLGIGFSTQPSYGSKTWLMPTLGYNTYDGIMAGLLIHNITVPENNFSYAIMPMYGFQSKTLGGTASIGFTSFSKAKGLHSIDWQLDAKTFSYREIELTASSEKLYPRFIKIAPSATFHFQKPFARSAQESALRLKAYWIQEEKISYEKINDEYLASKNGFTENWYASASYRYKMNSTFNPYGFTLGAELGSSYSKLFVEATTRIDYHLPKKGLHLRVYGGKFFHLGNNDYASNYRYLLSATSSGWNDYFYDDTYIGRNQQSGIASQQTTLREGGLKLNTLFYANQLGLTDNWLLSLNVKTDIPFVNLPIRLYADIATFADASNLNPSGGSVLFSTGVELHFKDFVSIYIPVYSSQDYQDYATSVLGKNAFFKSISFQFNFQNINFLRVNRKIADELIR